MSKKFNRYGQSQKKMSFSELFDRYYYVPIIAAALVAAVIIGVMVYNHFQENAYQKQLILGDKYLEDGKYEESILAFDSAIHIKDRNPAAYRSKAAVYAGTGNSKALTRLVKTYPTYFINYSLSKSSNSSNSQNYSLSSKNTSSTTTSSTTKGKEADFDDSVVALSADAKGQNKYSVDMDLVGANTEGGTIYYTTDGAKPTEKSKKYEKPVIVEVKDEEHPVTVKAIAKNEKKEQTKVFDTTLEYSDIKAPSIDTKKDEKNEGKYTVSMKCDEKNAEVFYTVDGKDPTKKSEQYKKPFTIEIKEGETKTIKAVSTLKDKTSSVVSSTIAREAKKNNEGDAKAKDGDGQKKEEKKVFVVMPTIVISQDGANAGVYHVDILTTTEGNKIYYTKDGKDPTVKSSVYKDAFTVKAETGKTITIKAIAVDKDGNVSEIAKQEETPVVVNLPKETDKKESEDKDSTNQEKQTKDTKDTKDNNSKNDNSKSSDTKSSDTKSSDTTTTKDKTSQSDQNKDTGLKDDSLPTLPKESTGTDADTSGSGSSSAKSDSSNTTSGSKSDSTDTTGNSKSSSGTVSEDTSGSNSGSSSKSDSGSSVTSPTPSATAPSVSAAPVVNLTAPVLAKSASTSGSGVKIEWQPVANADGYEYHYECGTVIEDNVTTATYYEAVKNKDNKSTAFTLKVRAYHTEGGKKTYSDWSTSYQGSFK